MADKFHLEIVTPSRRAISKDVEEVSAPGQEGEFMVMAWHTPFLTMLKSGLITYRIGGETGRLAVGRGYAEVQPEKTTILVERAETSDEIDLNKARSLLSEAEEDLKKYPYDAPEYQPLFDAYEFAQARLAAKEGKKV
jgi:F-type H+-transporting ATPase subunit epsilon